MSLPAPPELPRMLVITPDFPPTRGGIQVLTHELVRGLAGVQARVVTPAGEGGARFDADAGLSVRRTPSVGGSAAARNLALNAFAVREALRYRPQLTLSLHLVTSPAAAAIAVTLGARTVQYFHAKEIGNRPRLAAFAGRRAHASIAVSSYTSGLLAAAGVSPRDIHLIPPGVAPPAVGEPLASGRPTVLTVSRLADRYKGHDVVIRALAGVREHVPEVEWVVVGDGPLRPELEAQARSAGVAGSVRFLGSVSDEERDRWLRRADVFAMPSRLPGGGLAGEGFGMVYLEASSYGKPVVAGNVAGALDAVADGVTGLLVDPTDPLAVGDAITRLLLDRELAGRLGRAGADRSREFAWPVITGRVEAVLLEQLRLGAGSRAGGSDDRARTSA